MLPDVLVDDAACDLTKDNLADMIARFKASGNSQVMVEAVAPELVSQFGIVDLGGAALAQGESGAMQSIVEKPEQQSAPSNLAVVGRYVLNKSIWPLLAKTPLGAGGEIQLTDAIAMLMEREQVDAYSLRGKSHDCGSKIGYLKAIVEHAMRREEYSTELASLIDSIAKS